MSIDLMFRTHGPALPLSAAEGGTGQTSFAVGDILVATAATTLGKTSAGTKGQFYSAQGAATVGLWDSFLPPTIQKITSGSGTYNGEFYFLVTSANATAAATYTNNGVTFTVLDTIAAGTRLRCSAINVPATSGTLTKASGSGDATITFTAYRQPVFLRIRAVGGGGGGGGSATSAANNATGGGDGGDTTFGSSLITATAGQHGGCAGSGTNSSGGAGGLGATPTINSPAYGTLSPGNGGIGINLTSAVNSGGTNGPGSALFGGGAQGRGNGSSGGSGITNSGGGGGGAASSSVTPGYDGAAGSSGACVDAIIPSPSLTYAYAVGIAGTAGGAGTSGYAGGAGGSGYIEAWAHWQ